MNPLLQVRTLGQHIWLDNLSRTLLQEGMLARHIAEDGITGVTTNPAIFHKAIAGKKYYQEDLARLKQQPLSAETRYEHLAVADVQHACDLFMPLYKNSRANAGYVSLEVSPSLAHNSAGTIAAGQRLWQEVRRPNLMIKIPATAAGLEAVEALLAEGININVTLLFSLTHVEAVAKAHLRGLQKRLARGAPLTTLMSVASLFLSRVDTLIDAELEKHGDNALLLRGHTAVSMAKLAYQRYLTHIQSAEFAPLKAAGARPQYLLWASTGTKNPAYSDLLYVEPLIGPDTVNTMPDTTLAALRDHGRIAATLETGLAEARAHYQALEALNINPEAAGEKLQQEGLAQFEQAFGKLLELTA